MVSGASIVVELLPEISPQAIRNFIHLAQLGIYDGHAIERIDANTLIDVSYTAFGKEEAKRFIPNDTASGVFLSIEPGVLAMGGYENGNISAGEFFIPLIPAEQLTGQLPVIGKIISGFDKCKCIGSVPLVDSNYELFPGYIVQRPTVPEIIFSVNIDTLGAEYPEPDYLADINMPEMWKY